MFRILIITITTTMISVILMAIHQVLRVRVQTSAAATATAVIATTQELGLHRVSYSMVWLLKLGRSAKLVWTASYGSCCPAEDGCYDQHYITIDCSFFSCLYASNYGRL